MLPHRIAGGAIVVCDGKVLLVRYPLTGGGTYLAAPGGRVEQNESLPDAAVRETREETGVLVAPRKVLFIEDLLCSRYRMCMIWFLCDFITGAVQTTDDAAKEGIIEAAWFKAADLHHETVFPSILVEHDWASFASPSWPMKCAEIREMDS